MLVGEVVVNQFVDLFERLPVRLVIYAETAFFLSPGGPSAVSGIGGGLIIEAASPAVAQQRLEYLVANFPQAEETPLARERLTTLKSPAR